MGANQLKVAAIQLNCALGKKEKNIEKAEALIMEGIAQGAKLLVLPELFNTGYRVEEQDFTLAETIPGETTAWMHGLCKQHSIYLIGSLLEQDEVRGIIYNTAVAVGPAGVLGKYRKQRLWAYEKLRFRQGNQLELVKLDFINVGMQICYEIGFPEPARQLVLQGADLLVYPSAFGKERDYIWEIATRSRAVENGAFLIAANRSGVEREKTQFVGLSRIVNPQGRVLAEATFEDECIVSAIDLAEVVEERRRVPYLKDCSIN